MLNYCWEYVFTYTKGVAGIPLDRCSIGVPFTDKSNTKRGTRGKNGDLHCAGDIWFIPYKTIKSRDKDRPHPIKLNLT